MDLIHTFIVENNKIYKMTKFHDYKYERPSILNIRNEMENLIEKFDNSESFESQDNYFYKINNLKSLISSAYNICHIRHTINTKDKFYEEEQNFFDQNLPEIETLTNKFYRSVLKSKFKSELLKKWGKQFFVIADLSTKTINEAIVPLLQQENKLRSEYMKVKAAAEISFDGEVYNLSSIFALETSDDRILRKGATEAKWKFYEKNAKSIEGIFDKLVKVRHKIALELGYENFIQLGYDRMLRSDYDAVKIKDFRAQVKKHIVPLATKLFNKQKDRLALEKMTYYDEAVKFKTGNAKPKGNPEWIIKNAEKMYKELSAETNEFFQFMQDSNLMDLVNKDGKSTGGYCTFIAEHKAPYIFSNFNGTSGDIDVLTHEAGHAFQVYSSRNMPVEEYNWPTYEACEIHSMSMEFFAWPWMNLFFESETDKYKFAHLAGTITFMPYGVAVDEFQHFVYENPDATPAERNTAWKKIESEYLPHRNYDGNEFLEQGTFWQRQSHIFASPFYYIDYVLAEVCALQFWKRDQEDHKSAWSDYVKLCKKGGSESFLDLVEIAGLVSPFNKNCIPNVIHDVEDWLDAVDDSNF